MCKQNRYSTCSFLCWKMNVLEADHPFHTPLISDLPTRDLCSRSNELTILCFSSPILHQNKIFVQQNSSAKLVHRRKQAQTVHITFYYTLPCNISFCLVEALQSLWQHRVLYLVMFCTYPVYDSSRKTVYID